MSSYDPLRHGWVDRDGTFISDLALESMTPTEQAYWIQQQQLAQQQNSLNGLLNAGLSGTAMGLGSLLGNTAQIITTSNGTGSNTMSNVVYLGQFNPAQTVTPAKPCDEFTWLRGRVQEICWKES